MIDFVESARRDIEMDRMTRWKKFPEDLARYEAIIAEVQPAVIVETGTWKGESAYWFSHRCKQVVTIDTHFHLRPGRSGGGATVDVDGNIAFLKGNSASLDIMRRVRNLTRYCGGPVLVSLDSAHDTEHVMREIAAYAQIVTSGSYLVIEDTIHHWRPDFHESNPYIGLTRSVFALREFERDIDVEYMSDVTANPFAWLRKR